MPALWYFEVGNTVARQFPSEAQAVLAALRELALPEARVTADLEEIAVRLVSTKEITFYNAAYHAVALVNGGIFVTADERYFDRTHDVGGIVRLRDWAHESR